MIRKKCGRIPERLFTEIPDEISELITGIISKGIFDESLVYCSEELLEKIVKQSMKNIRKKNFKNICRVLWRNFRENHWLIFDNNPWKFGRNLIMIFFMNAWKSSWKNLLRSI